MRFCDKMSTNEGGGPTRYYFFIFGVWVRVTRMVFDVALDVEIWAWNRLRAARIAVAGK